MTKPTAAEMEEFWLRIRLIIDRGLHRAGALYGTETALAMAQQFDDGQWRLMTEIDLDDDKQPIPGSLKFRIDLFVPSVDEFVEFAAAKASVLGVSPELEAAEARWTALQHGNPPSAPIFTGDPECWRSRLSLPPSSTVGTVHIDWSHSNHWNRGRHQACPICSDPSFLLDDLARPAHKACVEDAVMNRRHLHVVQP
jgi:hypothetical protein